MNVPTVRFQFKWASCSERVVHEGVEGKQQVREEGGSHFSAYLITERIEKDSKL